MKNKIIYKDGKIIALDDKLGEVEYDYHDKMNEEVATENLIEQIQNSLESSKYALGCQENIKKTKYSKNKRYIKYILNILIPTVCIALICMLLSMGLSLVMLISLFGIVSGTFSNIVYKNEFDEIQDKINALSVRIDELKNKLNIEKRKLIEIRQNKNINSIQKINNNDFKQINEDKLQKLARLESLWYQTGYCINEYYNLEQEGILRETLHDEYTHNGELDEVERITKTYGPLLARKLTLQKNNSNR